MKSWKTQSARYLLVGVVSNVVLYVIYLALTAAGISPKLSMTLLFAIGTCQTFVFNRKWTFEHSGVTHWAFVRYLSAYAACYLLNLALLDILADRMHFPHQAVQAGAIIINAALLFIVQRYWVFYQKESQK